MTREEMLAVAKPILFNTKMVQSVKDNQKTATRRVVKPQPFAVKQDENAPCWCGHFVSESGKVLPDKPPYRLGDILYVRETFRLVDFEFIDGDWSANVQYKADEGIGTRFHYLKDGPDTKLGWRPSIHMPKEAARIFLRVTGVKVCRLQAMGHEDAEQEGCLCDYGEFAMPLDKFAGLWDSTIKPADRALYGWDANPWVWVIEFEKMI